ncbi:MAG: hypothetical protein ACSW75_06805, partial [Lachnospiraceae bacterium]
MNKKTNASHGTTFLTLFGLIAVGILLNLLGNRVNVALGLPLYLDNIGTIFSALLGGYIPCITVGFLTNIILGIADSYTTYYCVISVLIAVAAVSFSHHMRRLRIKYILLGILTFALLGGVLGGFLTWFINGQSFGEGFAVDFAARIQVFLPVGYIGTNLLSCFLLDILDKAIVTVIALILY